MVEWVPSINAVEARCSFTMGSDGDEDTQGVTTYTLGKAADAVDISGI